MFDKALRLAAMSGVLLFGVADFASAQQPPQDSAQSAPAPAALVIDDRRPPDSLQNHPLGSFLFGCENGVWNLGDRQVAADRLTRLSEELTSALGDEVRGQTLTVRKYDVYLNGRAFVEGAATADTGLIGHILAPDLPDPERKDVTLEAKCPRERMTAAWFATSEITNNNSPIVVEIDVSLLGHDYTARGVLSPARELWGDFHRNSVTPEMAAYVSGAMNLANRALLDEIADQPAGSSAAAPSH